MKRLFATLVATTILSHAAFAGELTVFERHGMRGNQITLRQDAANFTDFGFNDRASSVVVRSGAWELCEHKNFGGHCAIYQRGEYPDLEQFNNNISSAREVRVEGGGRGDWREGRDERRDQRRDGSWEERRDWREGRDDERRGGRHGEAVQLFEHVGFEGQRLDIDGDVRTLVPARFNDRVSSMIIREGTWELCEHIDYGGRCMTFGPGRYPSVERMNDRFSSLRRVR